MRNEMQAEGTANIEIGKKIKLFRQMKKMQKKELAEFFSVTIQQLDKYENGSNRISASKLFLMIDFFKVNPLYFFNNYNENKADNEKFMIEKNLPVVQNQEKIQGLISTFIAIDDEEIQTGLINLMKNLGKK